MDISPLQFYKCLADETRLLTLLLIGREQELCVCELVAALAVSQPKISRHLAQLRSCEILIDRREGHWVFYRINPALPAWAESVIKTTADNNADFIEQGLGRLAAMGERPERKSLCC